MNVTVAVLKRAFYIAADLRAKSPEGRALANLQQLHRTAAQVTRAGHPAHVITEPGRAGLAITVAGITHRCFTWTEIDRTLTMIAGGRTP